MGQATAAGFRSQAGACETQGASKLVKRQWHPSRWNTRGEARSPVAGREIAPSASSQIGPNEFTIFW